MTKTCIFASLLAKLGLGASDRWVLELWQKDVTLSYKNMEEVRETHRRPYLISTVTGDVVTCQNDALMDMIGGIMLIELLIGPAMQGRKGMMILDNCAQHRVAVLSEACEASNLHVEELPHEMTYQM